HRVSVWHAHHAEQLRAVAIVARGARLAVQVHDIGPYNFSVAIVLTQFSVALVTDQIVPVVQLAHHPRVAVRVWILDGQRHFVHDLIVLVHFDNAHVTGFGDKGQTVFQSLI